MTMNLNREIANVTQHCSFCLRGASESLADLVASAPAMAVPQSMVQPGDLQVQEIDIVNYRLTNLKF